MLPEGACLSAIREFIRVSQHWSPLLCVQALVIVLFERDVATPCELADVEGLIQLAHALHPTAGRRVAQHAAALEGWRDGGLDAREAVFTEEEWLALVRIKAAAQSSRVGESLDHDIELRPELFISLERFVALEDDEVDARMVRRFLLHAVSPGPACPE